MKALWTSWWSGLAALLLAGCTHSAARGAWPEIRGPVSALSLTPCDVKGVQGARCGRLDVPEDWAAPNGRRISLRVMVLPATGGAPSAEPVFVLTGGPGQSATEDAADFARARESTRAQRDIVLVDQRGTGGSNPLRCDTPQPEDDAPHLRQRARACLERLGASADVRFYTTPYAAEDLEAVRRALGYGRINLDGGSYGTRLALVYLRRHAEQVRSVVLKGISPPDFRNPLPFSQAGQAALERLLTNCGEDTKCHGAFPELRGEFQRVLGALERAPATVELKQEQGPAKTVRISRQRFAELVHLVLFIPDLASRLPYLIHGAARGNFETFARIAVAFEDAISARIYYGLQLAVVCPEDLARITPEDVARETPGTFLGDSLIRDYKAICGEWPQAPLPADYWELARVPVPALLLSGDRDPSTPPRFGEEVARYLPNGRQFILPGATHINRSACVDRVVADFIAAGSVEGLDTACLREPYRWEYFVPDGTAAAR